MSKVFLTSDTFFGRQNIIDIANRPFKTADEMDRTLIKNWNDTVGPGDIVYHLGNFAWDPIVAEKIIHELNGTIYIILGDYDDSLQEIANFHKNKLIVVQGQIIADSTRNIVLSHWPLADWPGKKNGTFHFHGHSINSHATDLSKENRVNVCCDNWSYKPMGIDSMIDIFKTYNESN